MREQLREIRTVQWMAMAFVVALVSALCLMVGAGTAFASPGDITTFKGTVHHSFISSGESVYYGYANGAKKVSDVKSSNTKVATAKVEKNGKYTSLHITMKKAGKTTITYKLAGKKKTATLVVSKYKNPFKSFKVGSKNYASKFKKMRSVVASADFSGKQVSIQPASGWKVDSIYVRNFSTGKSKTVKNGYKLKSYEALSTIIMVNKKTKAQEWMGLY